MLICCWSVKGGVGTTVVSALLALHHSRDPASGALLIDLQGDGAAALGAAPPDGPGLAEWLAADHDVSPDALTRLESEVRPGLAVVGRGSGELAPLDRLEVLAAELAVGRRTAVVDAGVLATAGPASRLLAAGADRSILVLRPCYLALQRASDLPIRPSGIVLLSEPGRVLGGDDVERVVGAPVVCELAVDPAVARAVDAGLLAARLPRGVDRALGHAA